MYSIIIICISHPFERENELKAMESQHIRYDRLRKTFDTALIHSNKILNDKQLMQKIFPRYSKYALGKEHLSNAQQQSFKYWSEMNQKNFLQILEQKDIKSKLNSLDELLIVAENNFNDDLNNEERENKFVTDDKNFWKLDTNDLFECYLHNEHLTTINELDKRLIDLKQKNKSLKDELFDLQNLISNDSNFINEKINTLSINNNDFNNLNNELTQMISDLKDITVDN